MGNTRTVGEIVMWTLLGSTGLFAMVGLALAFVARRGGGAPLAADRTLALVAAVLRGAGYLDDHQRRLLARQLATALMTSDPRLDRARFVAMALGEHVGE